VATSTVPITGLGLGVEGDDDVEFLADTQHEETGHPNLVTTVDTSAGTNLVLPLTGHNLRVSTGDVKTGVQTGAVVSVTNTATKGVLGSAGTVIRSLCLRVSVDRPSERGDTIRVEQGVFLFNTEPGDMGGGLVHNFLAVGVGVGRDGGLLTVREDVLAKDQDVGGATEGILVHSNRDQVNFRVLAIGLSSTRTIVVPDGEVLDLGGSGLQSAGLASDIPVISS